MKNPSPATVRSSTAAEAEALYIPGQKSAYELPDAPIDLPDDFGVNDADYGHTISWMAVAFLTVVIIALVALWWVMT